MRQESVALQFVIIIFIYKFLGVCGRTYTVLFMVVVLWDVPSLLLRGNYAYLFAPVLFQILLCVVGKCTTLIELDRRHVTSVSLNMESSFVVIVFTKRAYAI